MVPLMFEKPVQIIVGFGLPAEIRSVIEAVTLLNGWPPSQRKPEHSIALKACQAAWAGEIEAETARSLFIAFARRNDLLAPEAEEIVAARETGALGDRRPTG